jgi:predicted phage tail protein
VNANGSSAFAGPVTVVLTAPAVPAAPGGFTAAAVLAGSRYTVTLNWTDNSNNESSFTIQRATNSAFTTGVNSSTAAANTTTLQQTSVPRSATGVYYYRIRAVNAVGNSAWLNATPFPVPAP